MKKINFSYQFSKITHNGKLIEAARLMQVIELDLADISQELRDYDTDFGKFKIPAKGLYLLLLFMHPNGSLFTTLRRHTPPKAEYYKASVGFVFQIHLMEPL